MNILVVGFHAVLLGILALFLCVNTPVHTSHETASLIEHVAAQGDIHGCPASAGAQANGCELSCAVVTASALHFRYIPQQEPASFHVVHAVQTRYAAKPIDPPPRSSCQPTTSLNSTL